MIGPMKKLFDRQTIQQRVADLGQEISRDYHQDEMVVVGILNGAFIFMADLVRAIQRPVHVDFMEAHSYEGMESTGTIKLFSDLKTDITGRHVLLVEDIVDTGHTIAFLHEQLTQRGPASLKICTLLSKPDKHNLHHLLNYVGFEISNEFVVGYGLDFNGRFRELPDIMQVVASS